MEFARLALTRNRSVLLCCVCVFSGFRALDDFTLNSQEQSSGLFTLGVVSYCLGVALVCERLNLSHEVRRGFLKHGSRHTLTYYHSKY